MAPTKNFELVVRPVGESDIGVELRQLIDNGRGQGRVKVVAADGMSLQAVGDQLMEALRKGGYKPSDLRRNRKKPLLLPEQAGVRLSLALLAIRPLRKIRRIEEVREAIRSMSDDEAYYWYAKCTDADTGRRARRALRDMVSDR